MLYHTNKHECLAQALHDYGQEQRQAGREEVMDAVLNCGCSLWTTGEPTELAKAQQLGQDQMGKVKDEAARSAAKQPTSTEEVEITQ